MKKEWVRKSEQWILWLSILLILILSGCGGAIGTKDVGFRKAYEQINANALLDEEYSVTSKNVLQRYNMGQFFRENPLKCLNELHKKIKIDNRRDLLFSLAELNYFTAKYTLRDLDDSPLPETGKYYLNAAIYGYFYLFDETRNKPANPFNRRFRLACDIYNIALAKAMTNPKGNLVFEAGTRRLPFGAIDLSLNARNFPVKLDQVSKIVAADRLDIYGLSRRNRDAGLGVPFIAVGKKTKKLPVKRSSPGTLFMRIKSDVQALESGSLQGSMELYAPFDRTRVEVEGRSVPLESDLSAQWAYNLNQPAFCWISRVFSWAKAPFPPASILSNPTTPHKFQWYLFTVPPAARSGGRKWPIPLRRTRSSGGTASSGSIFTIAANPWEYQPASFVKR